MASLEIDDVRKSFGGVEALRGVSLSVADGELLAVLGPSGSGKSTLLRVVAGLDEADAGTVRIGGRDVTRLHPARRNVSMVFQSYALFPHMTVAENIGFGLVVREVPKAEARERASRAAETAGVAHLVDRRPEQLSGGERQRVALARAIVREPDAFLLDEPLSNLDLELRTQMRAELKELQRRLRATTVYVTHDQFEALTLGDRIAVLRDGAVQQVDTPDEMWARPANRFVARFVGSPPMRFAPPSALAVDAPDGAVMGTRAEHLVLGSEGTPAVVTLVEPVGSEAFVHLDLDGHELVARVDAATRPQVGERVRVRATAVHLFDGETGERLEWS